MQFTDDRHHLRVVVSTLDCDIPPDERARLQTLLTPLEEAVSGFPGSELAVKVIFHERSRAYHIEYKLQVPGQTLLGGEEDPYLDSALARGIRKLARKVQMSKGRPAREDTERAARRAALARDVVAPEGPDAGPLAAAVEAGDYRAFRTALVGYEDWLRLRVGR